MIGAVVFAEIAQELENAGKSGDEAFIDEHHAAFVKAYRSFKDLLAGMFADKASEEDRPLADDSMMEGVMDDIRSSAESMDCNALEDIFREMDNYRIPEGLADVYAKIKAAAAIYDYDAILELLKENS